MQSDNPNTDFHAAVILAIALSAAFYGVLIAGILVAMRELGGGDAE